MKDYSDAYHAGETARRLNECREAAAEVNGERDQAYAAWENAYDALQKIESVLDLYESQMPRPALALIRDACNTGRQGPPNQESPADAL